MTRLPLFNELLTMGSPMSKNSSTETDSIVLETARPFAQLGNPNDPNEVFETECVEVDGETRYQVNLPADRYAAAHAILRKYDAVSVVEDPGLGLDEVMSEAEARRKWSKRQVEAKQRRRERTYHFDPENPPKMMNHKMVLTRKAYQALLDAGEPEAAEELRTTTSVDQQHRRASTLCEERLGTNIITL